MPEELTDANAAIAALAGDQLHSLDRDRLSAALSTAAAVCGADADDPAVLTAASYGELVVLVVVTRRRLLAVDTDGELVMDLPLDAVTDVEVCGTRRVGGLHVSTLDGAVDLFDIGDRAWASSIRDVVASCVADVRRAVASPTGRPVAPTAEPAKRIDPEAAWLCTGCDAAYTAAVRRSTCADCGALLQRATALPGRVERLALDHLESDALMALADEVELVASWGDGVIMLSDCRVDGILVLLVIRTDGVALVGANNRLLPVERIAGAHATGGGRVVIDITDGDPLVCDAIGDDDRCGEVVDLIATLLAAGAAAARDQANRRGVHSDRETEGVPTVDVGDRSTRELLLDRCTYLGGLDSVEPRTEVCALLDDNGVGLWDPRRNASIVWLAWPEVRSLGVDGPAEAQRRITATRVLTLGVLALAFPKTEKHAYLVVETESGDLIIAVAGHTAVELHALVSPYRRLAGAPTSPEAPASSPASQPAVGPPASEDAAATRRRRLAELRDLHADGLITEDDYARRRMEILSEL